jgi:cAMP-dependent protein kinase regulator
VPAVRPAGPLPPTPEEQKKIAERKAKKEAIQSLVRGIPLLKDVPFFQFELVLDRIHCRMLEQGAYLFREGEAGSSIVFVASGSLNVTARGAEGEIELGRLGPGAIAGEIAFLSNIPRTATVQATTDVTLLEFERQAVDQVVRRNRSLATTITNLYRERVLDAVLAHSVLFSGLPREERDRFAHRFLPIEAKAGDQIVLEGEAGDAIFILRRGQARVSRSHRGQELPLAMLSPPEVLGDIAPTRGTARIATVTAVTHCELLRLSREDLMDLLGRNPSIRGKLEQVQYARFVSAAEKLNA